MDWEACWVSHPEDWQPLLDRWQQEFPGRATYHAWEQYGGPQVRGLTLGDDGPERPVRLLVAVPHGHEPAPTAASVNLAALLLTGALLNGSQPDSSHPFHALTPQPLNALVTFLPDTNSQGRTRSPRRVWDGDLDNEAFLKYAFGIAADGERFGRYPEWRFAEHHPRRVGLAYEELEPGLWVESNTDRRSTHSRAIDELFQRYGYTHYLDMHQHEGDEAALLPADFDDQPEARQEHLRAWATALLSAWEAAGIRHKGSYVPYRGLPRQQFFRDYWAGRCPGMFKLTSESRNNRHIPTDERTPLERQFRSACVALAATVGFLSAA